LLACSLEAELKTRGMNVDGDIGTPTLNIHHTMVAMARGRR